jgi:hypothetical protein
MNEEYLRMRLEEIVTLTNNLREEMDYGIDFVVAISYIDLNEDGDMEISRMTATSIDLPEVYEEVEDALRVNVHRNYMRSYPSKAFQTDAEVASVLSKAGVLPYGLN